MYTVRVLERDEAEAAAAALLTLVLSIVLPFLLVVRQQQLKQEVAINNFDYDDWYPSQSPSSSFETCRTQSVFFDEYGIDDKDEMAMELVYSVSPNGTFKRSIKGWQKGDFLGRGSFGTVHEGFTDDKMGNK